MLNSEHASQRSHQQSFQFMWPLLVFLSLYYPLNSQISTSQLRHLLSSNIYTVPMLPMYTMDLEKLDLQAKDSYYDIYH